MFMNEGEMLTWTKRYSEGDKLVWRRLLRREPLCLEDEPGQVAQCCNNPAPNPCTSF